MVVLSHVDDMELYATEKEFQGLIEFLRKKKLKIKVEGPLREQEGSMSFLKRIQRSKRWRCRDHDEFQVHRRIDRSVGVGKFVSKETAMPSGQWKGNASEERRNGPAIGSGSPHVQERCWYTVVWDFAFLKLPTLCDLVVVALQYFHAPSFHSHVNQSCALT